MKFNLIIEFCKQITDTDEQTTLIEAHESLNSLKIGYLQIYDKIEQNVGRGDVYQLLISLKECKMTKLVFNGMNNKVVESLLGNSLKH